MIFLRNKTQFLKRVLPITRGIVHRCLKVSASYCVPLLGATSFIVLAKAQRINPGTRGSKRVVYIGSRASLRDIDEIARFCPDIKFYTFERFRFRPVLEHFFSQQLPTEGAYHHDSNTSHKREALDQFMDALVVWINKFWRIDALITSNIGYIDQQAFIASARKKGVWSVVLFKEGFCHPAQFLPLYREIKRGQKGNCDLFLCSAEFISDGFSRLVEEGIVCELNQQSIRVTGIPRLDSYLRERPVSDDVSLTFFTFNWRNKINVAEISGRQKSEIDTTVSNLYEWLLTFADDHPNSMIVIKTKSEVDHAYEEVRRRIQERGRIGDRFNNVVLSSDMDVESLIKRSTKILSFSSTTLVESLLAGKSIACPDFRRILRQSGWNIFEGFDELVVYPQSYDEFKNWVRSDQPTSHSQTRREQFIERYFHNTDGQAGRRVADEILRLCDDSP